MKYLKILLLIILVLVVSLILADIKKIYPEKALTKCYPDNKNFSYPIQLGKGDNLFLDQYDSQKMAFLRSMFFYPQLEDKKIRVVRNDYSGSLYARFDVFPELFPNTETQYKILIDTVKENKISSITLFDSLSLNAKIGVLTHELSHIDSYSKMNLYAKAAMGIQYILFEASKRYIENTTEINTIKNGAGLYLKEWSNFQHHIKIKEGKGYLYFSPIQIDSIINECSCLSNPNLQPFRY